VAEGTPYVPTEELLDQLNCHFYAHGDDPVVDQFGNDITKIFSEKGKYKQFKRTEGVSTTNITSKLLALADANSQSTLESEHFATSKSRVENPPKQNFLANTRRIINFANHNLPLEQDTIVYIQGSFDLLHHGHMRRLELAKQLGDYLYVGLWDDDMVRYYRGNNYPI
jgi:ethanolamine-phosphate cytidylyltransferase